MRERTTWDRSRIASDLYKVAEDPRAMNQDHHNQQPGADDYVIGGPSDFAEDVHPSEGTWKADQGADGNTDRNEIGMPEMRDDTFKQAGLDLDQVQKKATLATKVARAMLSKTASEHSVEEQALSLMSLTASALHETLSRLASQDDDDEDEDEGQEKQAKKAEQDEQDSDEGQEKQAKKAEQDSDEEDEGQEKQAKKAEQDEKEAQDEEEKQAKKAGEMPPQFKENAEKKKEEAEAKKDEDSKEQSKEAQAQEKSEDADPEEDDGQQKKASQMTLLAQQLQDAVACGDMQAQQQAMQAMQQLVGQQHTQAQQQVSNDELMDQMLADQDGQVMESDIQMDTPQMDVGDVQMGEEDAILGQVFASSPEVQNAMNAASLQGQDVTASQGTTRTASTRTVGTRPTSGVTALGGAGSSDSSSDTTKLSSLWQSAPDVSGLF